MCVYVKGIDMNTVKECENHCPKCDSDIVDWGDIEPYDGGIYQNCVCKECDCVFREYFTYINTEIID